MKTALASGPRVPPDDASVAVRALGLGRKFSSAGGDVWAVRDVSLDVRSGEFVALVGASGSGKSTLLGLIGGLDTPTCGTVSVLGTDVGSLGEDQRSDLRLASVGIVFQDNNLLDELTAAENVALPLEAAGIHRRRANQAALNALASVGLTGLGDRLPADLSGGQGQRVGIARAIVGHRRLLLADEPTGALDSESTRKLFQQVASMCGDGMTAIVVTHDLTVMKYADVSYELTDGHLSPGTPGRRIAEPCSAAVARP